MYYNDESEAIDQNDPTHATEGNSGLFARFGWGDASAVFDLITRPHADLFHQDRPIIPNVDVRLKFTRSQPQFCLMAATNDKDYQIKIHEASLLVRLVEPSDSIILAHNRALESGMTCKYPVHRCEMSNYSIPQGIMNHTRASAVKGQLPVRVVLGLVRNDALNGSYTLNGYDFSPHDLNFLSIVVNGRVIGGKPLTPSFTDKGQGLQYVRAYETLYSGTDQYLSPTGNAIGRLEYLKGYTLFAFKISEDFGDDFFGLKREGNLQIDIHFGTPLKTTLNVVMYMEFLNILEIDKNRFTTFDYEA
jgi:hypothetical protein